MKGSICGRWSRRVSVAGTAIRLPQLRSSESFNRLMDELSGTENRIAVERQRYNEAVQAYNVSRRSFPSNITASVFGFKDEYPLYEAPTAAQQVPKVNFGKGTN